MKITQVDAFTAEPFRGNSAAVCLLDAPRHDRWMQDVAHEMNLAETAFLLPAADGFSLRWFTPVAEVDLCGHATLATAHTLWEERILALDAIARFHTRSGLLTAVRHGDWIELDFPSTPPTLEEPPAALSAVLGAPIVGFGRSRFDYFVELASDDAVRKLTPDIAGFRQLDARGIIVTAGSDDPRYDFVSRFFAPAVGVDEDPVTGSAHCCLAPFWAGRLGRDELTGFQASARGGVVRVRVAGDRVKLGGQAITVLKGELLC